ncbi:hypothetical protein E4U21_004433 [Claviceps maximensis]|nr:hypothetical protein E4U21_004433 [Claviceps maximensis]
MTAVYRIKTLTGLYVCLLLFTVFLCFASANDECQPWTWGANLPGAVLKLLSLSGKEDDGNGPGPKPGEVNCRAYFPSPAIVNYYTCTQLSQANQITTDKFFMLNRDIKKDCSNIQPNTRYCIRGCMFTNATPRYILLQIKRRLTHISSKPVIEPLRAYDGLCGPNHNNATCYGTSKPCCNSKTWKCGDSTTVLGELAMRATVPETEYGAPTAPAAPITAIANARDDGETAAA